MSAWSDYRCGAIDEDEFDLAMRRECGDGTWEPADDTALYDCDADSVEKEDE